MEQQRQHDEHPELVRIRDREGLWVTGHTLRAALAGHLPPGEQVHELLLGAVGPGRAVLALTDQRVVVAQEPRAGGVCADVPLEQLTDVEWARHGPTGTLALRTRRGCTTLRHVDLRRGAAVATAVRARAGAQALAASA